MGEAGGVGGVVGAVGDVAVEVRVAAIHDAAGVGALPAAGVWAVPAGAVFFEVGRGVALCAGVVEELVN